MAKSKKSIEAVAALVLLVLFTIVSLVALIAEPLPGCFWDNWYGVLIEKVIAVVMCTIATVLWKCVLTK